MYEIFSKYSFFSLIELRKFIAEECGVKLIDLEQECNDRADRYVDYIISFLNSGNLSDVSILSGVFERYKSLYSSYEIEKVLSVANFISSCRQRDYLQLETIFPDLFKDLGAKIVDKQTIQKLGYCIRSWDTSVSTIDLAYHTAAEVDNTVHITYSSSKSVNYYSVGLVIASNISKNSKIIIDFDEVFFPLKLFGVSNLSYGLDLPQLTVRRGEENVKLFQYLLAIKLFLDRVDVSCS